MTMFEKSVRCQDDDSTGQVLFPRA